MKQVSIWLGGQRRRRWYHYILDVIGFGAMLLLIEFILSQSAVQRELGIPSIWGHVTIPMANLTEFKESDPPDIVIIGSSQSMTSIDPVALSKELKALTGEDISVVNNSVNWAAGLPSARLMTELYSQFYLPPIILMAASTHMFPNYYNAANWERISESTGLQLWFDDQPYTPLVRWMLRHSRLWQYSNNLAQRLAGYPGTSPDVLTERGFLPVKATDPNIATVAANTNFIDFFPPGRDWKALEEFAAWCDAQDVLLVLFTVPEHAKLIETKPDNERVLLDHLQQLDASSSNVIFLDLTSEGRLDDAAYYDPMHVNVNGAAVWTARLARFMVRERVLEAGRVGVVRVYGDNQFVVFNLESQGRLDFYALTPELNGVLVQQLPAESWKPMREGDVLTLTSDVGELTIRLEKRKGVEFYLTVTDTGGKRISEGAFEIPSLRGVK